MTKYRSHFQTKKTPQSEAIPGKDMVQNSAGGFSFAVSDWERLQRFLILGTEGGTYYATEKKLTVENAQAIVCCIKEDGLRVVKTTVEISQAGRAPKNDPALFVLAMCAGLGDNETKRAALEALTDVARIGTHLFHFLDYVQGFRGWGRGLRDAIAHWYTSKDAEKLAYQAVKYQQRDGWSHRDALRLAHAKPANGEQNAVFRWIVKGGEAVEDTLAEDNAMRLIWAFEHAKRAEDEQEIIKLITDFGLTREMIPTQWLNSQDVWAALFEKMPMTAMIRNLGKMSQIGLLEAGTGASKQVVERLTSQEALKRSRIHPLAVLTALKVYQQGRGIKGKLAWTPVTKIVDALDEAFYMAFGNVEPTGKSMMLALDVSGSMEWGKIAGSPLTPREASAAMALVTARTEPDTHIVAFSNKLVDVTISPRQRLDDVLRETGKIPMGGTDCALPMIHALKKKMKVDLFSVYTDSETWFGNIHPCQALENYRRKMNIPAKLVVVGMLSNGFSIADPNDSGMLDLVGFDTASPQLISDFARD